MGRTGRAHPPAARLAVTPANRMSGGHLLAWAAEHGAEFSAEIDPECCYRRLRVRNGREPLGCIVASSRGRRWYFAPIESESERVARVASLEMDLIEGMSA